MTQRQGLSSRGSSCPGYLLIAAGNDCVLLQNDCLDLHKDCLALQSDCLALRKDCLALQNDCLDLHNGCLALREGCLDLHNGCLRLQNHFGLLPCDCWTVICRFSVRRRTLRLDTYTKNRCCPLTRQHLLGVTGDVGQMLRRNVNPPSPHTCPSPYRPPTHKCCLPGQPSAQCCGWPSPAGASLPHCWDFARCRW